ncbi:hypothetical protein FNI11_04305 [Salmonella enterica subsp. salamae]|nr:hypothetical protein [Salmonella enterica subsp. salamae]ECJ2280142.1 hypothetical protein [Salmonella enterica subsp. salamae]
MEPSSTSLPMRDPLRLMGMRRCKTERCNLPFFSVTIVRPDNNINLRLCRRLCANLAMVG